MASQGNSETSKLKANVESQVNRLLTQLQDLEDMKDEFDEEEYNSTRQETIDQLREFEASLKRMVSGDLSLVNDIGRVQLAIQSAIRTSVNLDAVQNFKTRENIALKSKLSTSDVDFKLGKMTAVEYDRVKHETLLALQKLGEVMSPIDQEFLVQKQRGSTTFAVASNEDSDVGQRVVDLAAGRI